MIGIFVEGIQNRRLAFGKRAIRSAKFKLLAERGADFVVCMVAFPGQFFYSMQNRVCVLLFTKNKSADAKRELCDRRTQTRLIDAFKLGSQIGADVADNWVAFNHNKAYSWNAVDAQPLAV